MDATRSGGGEVVPARLARLVQELYDATTLLHAALTFTFETADLLAPELDYAVRRLIVARSDLRKAGAVVHTDAALLPMRELPAPFNSGGRRITRLPGDVTAMLELLDDILGGWQRYRRWRGGYWFFASCPDGGWFRHDEPIPDLPRVEDYTVASGRTPGDPRCK